MADVITITGEVTFKAWCAPNFAKALIGEVEASIPVANLADNALDALAQTWLNHLYAGVGRKPPVIFPPETPKG